MIARWLIVGARTNLAMSLDEAHDRLFVVTRNPTKLFVLNTRNGKTVATLDVPAINDGVSFDAARRRIYVPGAEGEVGIYQEIDADHYRELARVPAVPGAKSETYVPQLHELFVGVSPRYNKPKNGWHSAYQGRVSVAKTIPQMLPDGHSNQARDTRSLNTPFLILDA